MVGVIVSESEGDEVVGKGSRERTDQVGVERRALMSIFFWEGRLKGLGLEDGGEVVDAWSEGGILEL